MIASPPSFASIFAAHTNARRQRPVLFRAGEIFLVGAHRQDDHLARHVEEILVEPAEQRHRPLGQPGILDHQPFVLDQRQPGGRSRFARAVAYQLLALLGIDDDMARAQFLDIVVSTRRS